MEVKKEIHETSHLRQYFSKTPWYLLSSLTTKAISFFLLPVYTRFLSPEEYGILANLESFMRLLPVFISLYMDAAFRRYYYLEKQCPERVRLLYSTHFWFQLFWGGIMVLLLMILAPLFFDNLLGISFLPVVLVICSQLLNQLCVMVTGIWRANLWVKSLTVFQLSMTLIGVVVSLYLLIPLEMGW